MSWLRSLNIGKGALGKAVQYTLDQWKYLERYLLDGRLEISNSRAERSIKPFVIGRKNFLFSNTPKGVKASAVWYSMVETAKENGLNLYEYLVVLLQNCPTVPGRLGQIFCRVVEGYRTLASAQNRTQRITLGRKTHETQKTRNIFA